jgi:hypothetical protein
MDMPLMPDRLDRKTVTLALALALLLFCIYNANFRHGTGVDTISTTALPVSIITEHNFNLDEFRALLSTNTNALDANLLYFGGIQQRDGHLVSSYPLGGAVLAVPFFAIAKYGGYLRQWHHYRVVGKIAASFMVALSAAFIFLTLRLTIPTNAAWGIALLFGLGTSAWSISSQELWQHGPGTLCLSIALYALALLDRQPSHRRAFVAGLFLGLAVYCRLLNVIPTLALSLFVVAQHRKYLAIYCAPLLVMAVVMAYYNLSTYGNISGGYDAIYQSPIHAWRGLNSTNSYTNPLLKGFADTLISPNRGLLIYSPFLIPAFIAMSYLFFRPQYALQRYCVLWFVAMCIILAKNTLWWGGATFGPRYFSEACVALALLTGGAWSYLRQHRILLGVFFCSGAISIFIHGVGALLAPCGWELEPISTDLKPERFWDWRDPEIVRCTRYGLQNGFKTPELLRFKDGDRDF